MKAMLLIYSLSQSMLHSHGPGALSAIPFSTFEECEQWKPVISHYIEQKDKHSTLTAFDCVTQFGSEGTIDSNEIEGFKIPLEDIIGR